LTANKAKKVFVSGKFAVIHSGHIRLFMFAKTIGINLIVALDTEGLDEAEIEWRTSFLKNQEFVDEVVLFNADIEKTILRIKPDIIIKGSEFSSRNNIEKEIVSTYGGELIFSSGSTFFSERDLLNSDEVISVDYSEKIPKDFLKRNGISLSDISEQILKFNNIKVCVIGDVIIDEYINCHPLGMSREEPNIVVTPIDSQKFLGGAGIVAAHTVGLGATTRLITITGKDEAGSWAVSKAAEYGITIKSIEDKTRPTNLKQRYKAGLQTLLKISHLSQDVVSDTIQNQIINEFEKIAPDIDLLILSDFSYGVLTKEVTTKLIKIAKLNGLVIAADSQTSSQLGDLSQFANVDLITPTETEARLELKDQKSGLAVIADKLRSKINSQSIIIKLGADGLVINGVKLDGTLLSLDALPAFNQNPIDVSGAGDSLLAAASLAITIENNLAKASLIGSLAAAIQIGRVGNIPIEKEKIISLIQK
jgi:rfaE bifunctional protein kinase chain/domain